MAPSRPGRDKFQAALEGKAASSRRTPKHSQEWLCHQERKMQALLSLWLRELAADEYPSLQQVLDDVGRKSKDSGLTPEMLDSLLKGA
jgi:hypothetical protein